MNFLQWLHRYAAWSTYWWLSVIAVGAVAEITGFIRKDGTTFTDLVRATVPVGWRMVVLLVLGWHFCMAKANFPHKWWWF